MSQPMCAPPLPTAPKATKRTAYTATASPKVGTKPVIEAVRPTPKNLRAAEPSDNEQCSRRVYIVDPAISQLIVATTRANPMVVTRCQPVSMSDLVMPYSTHAGGNTAAAAMQRITQRPSRAVNEGRAPGLPKADRVG